jgi:uncharacterized alpha-E superfamily protein
MGFMDLGCHLKRADKTTRFLDVSSYLPTATDNADAISPGILHWTATLRSCGAMGAFAARDAKSRPKAWWTS